LSSTPSTLNPPQGAAGAEGLCNRVLEWEARLTSCPHNGMLQLQPGGHHAERVDSGDRESR
jgi:hypothetical protein